VIAACLRNARAVAHWLNERHGAVAVIACGERWPDGSLRPALEDHLGAGAVLSDLNGQPSPEARATAALWNSQRAHLQAVIRASASGRELHARGWDDDLDYAIDDDASATVPVLTDGAFIDARDT
jgi:2-phosphosulfolactate phosphatase